MACVPHVPHVPRADSVSPCHRVLEEVSMVEGSSRRESEWCVCLMFPGLPRAADSVSPRRRKVREEVPMVEGSSRRESVWCVCPMFPGFPGPPIVYLLAAVRSGRKYQWWRGAVEDVVRATIGNRKKCSHWLANDDGDHVQPKAL